jgi:CAAX prenyl protease-like protein
MDYRLGARPNQRTQSAGTFGRGNYHERDRLKSAGVARIFWSAGPMARWNPMVRDCFPNSDCHLPHGCRNSYLLCSRSTGLRLLTRETARTAGAFCFILLFVALGEEPGWRGFALPQLQTRYTPFIASLVLAPVWALWHLPLFGNEFPWPIVPPFVLSVFGGTFVLTWVFNGAKGSVLLTMLLHATLNTVSAGLIFPVFSGAALVALWWIYTFLWLCAGLAVLLFST